MTIKEALNFANKKISHLDTEVLLAHILKKDKTFLFAHPDYRLRTTAKKQYLELVGRRAYDEPSAYLTGHKEFYGLDFEVNKHVLVPRPETELLVDEAIKIIDQKSLTIYKIADIGAGSGNIAISIAKNLPPKNKIKIYATDISQKAIEIAKRNARNHNVKINFLQGDLLEPLPQKVELMVANLPYLTSQQITPLRQGYAGQAINNQPAKGEARQGRQLKSGAKAWPEQAASLQFEPNIALDGGKDGLDLIKKMLKQAPNYLNPNGQILLEIDPGQAQFFRRYYPKTIFKKDLARRTRLAIVPCQALL